MKICIVTLYKTINSGSYWQARTLGMVFEKMGHYVCYYNVKYNKKNMLNRYINIIKVLLKSGCSASIKYIKSLSAFSKAQSQLNILNDKKDYLNNIDYFVLGSDTIWNLNSQNLISNIDIFWGRKFSGNNIITYAGSVGNTSKDKFNDFPQLEDCVKLWSDISVRDKLTYEIISNMTDNNIKMVCDPTLLLYKKNYLEIVRNRPNKKYIFLYLFDALNKKQIDCLREFAKIKGLKIIQGVTGNKLKYCDEMITNSPDEFLRYMLYADYIITDTFHGTVFSVNLEKQFVSINRNKNKVNEFLETMGFSERLVSSEQNLELELNNIIDYENRMNKLDELRISSYDFLQNALK